jgi:hypothetical protein
LYIILYSLIFKDQLTKVIKKLASIKKYPDDLINFLKAITSRNSIVPDKYLSTLEMVRLKFSIYGSLKEQTFERKKMLVLGFIVVRIIIKCMLCIPDQIFHDVRLNPHMIQYNSNMI